MKENNNSKGIIISVVTITTIVLVLVGYSIYKNITTNKTLENSNVNEEINKNDNKTKKDVIEKNKKTIRKFK